MPHQKSSAFLKEQLERDLKNKTKGREAKTLPPVTAALFSQPAGHKYFDQFHGRRKKGKADVSPSSKK